MEDESEEINTLPQSPIQNVVPLVEKKNPMMYAVILKDDTNIERHLRITVDKEKTTSLNADKLPSSNCAIWTQQSDGTLKLVEVVEKKSDQDSQDNNIELGDLVNSEKKDKDFQNYIKINNQYFLAETDDSLIWQYAPVYDAGKIPEKIDNNQAQSTPVFKNSDDKNNPQIKQQWAGIHDVLDEIDYLVHLLTRKKEKYKFTPWKRYEEDINNQKIIIETKIEEALLSLPYLYKNPVLAKHLLGNKDEFDIQKDYVGEYSNLLHDTINAYKEIKPFKYVGKIATPPPNPKNIQYNPPGTKKAKLEQKKTELKKACKIFQTASNASYFQMNTGNETEYVDRYKNTKPKNEVKDKSHDVLTSVRFLAYHNGKPTVFKKQKNSELKHGRISFFQKLRVSLIAPLPLGLGVVGGFFLASMFIFKWGVALASGMGTIPAVMILVLGVVGLAYLSKNTWKKEYRLVKGSNKKPISENYLKKCLAQNPPQLSNAPRQNVNPLTPISVEPVIVDNSNSNIQSCLDKINLAIEAYATNKLQFAPKLTAALTEIENLLSQMNSSDGALNTELDLIKVNAQLKIKEIKKSLQDNPNPLEIKSILRDIKNQVNNILSVNSPENTAESKQMLFAAAKSLSDSLSNMLANLKSTTKNNVCSLPPPALCNFEESELATNTTYETISKKLTNLEVKILRIKYTLPADKKEEFNKLYADDIASINNEISDAVNKTINPEVLNKKLDMLTRFLDKKDLHSLSKFIETNHVFQNLNTSGQNHSNIEKERDKIYASILSRETSKNFQKDVEDFCVTVETYKVQNKSQPDPVVRQFK